LHRRGAEPPLRRRHHLPAHIRGWWRPEPVPGHGDRLLQPPPGGLGHRRSHAHRPRRRCAQSSRSDPRITGRRDLPQRPRLGLHLQGLRRALQPAGRDPVHGSRRHQRRQRDGGVLQRDGEARGPPRRRMLHRRAVLPSKDVPLADPLQHQAPPLLVPLPAPERLRTRLLRYTRARSVNNPRVHGTGVGPKAGARPSVSSSCEDASSPTGEIMSSRTKPSRFGRLRGILAVVVVIVLMGWFATENREALTKVYSTITEALPTSSQAQPVPDGAWLESGSTSIDPQQLASLDVAEQDRSEDDYERDEFGDGWASVGDGCDTRDQILNRDLVEITYEDGSDCEATDGTLHDPYTGITIDGNLSEDVQIDHIVSLSDAWYSGAEDWSSEKREAFANDSANLVAVDASANMSKSDDSIAEWYPGWD